MVVYSTFIKQLTYSQEKGNSDRQKVTHLKKQKTQNHHSHRYLRTFPETDKRQNILIHF